MSPSRASAPDPVPAPAGPRRRRGPSRAAEIRRAARHRLGLADLRPGQLEAIEAAVAGRDVLAVMPTGYGKSAIYQVAGTLVRGPTIVVSPMIALQRDQVRAIEGTDAGGAAAFNSTQRESERRDALRGVRRGKVEFLLLAPEQLASPDRLRKLAGAGARLFVVDEAHCISEWGHDFRPDYLRLGEAIRALGRPTVLALTATASPPVRAEILERLGIPDALVVAGGFDRPNLRLEVRRFTDAGSKRAALVDAVAAAEGPGIVYAATRRGAEEVAAALRDRGGEAGAYHAGMAAGDRERAQQAFMDGSLEVMVATTAFGMGVDKPDVRFVFHHDVPGSVDAYYQEIGRAGRDGLPATAILFYRPEDLSLHRFFAASAGSAEARADAGAGSGTETRGDAAGERRRAFERSRLDMMRGYAEVHDCRREFVLNYFGEAYDDPCDNCDNCEAGLVVLEEGGRAFPLGSRVRHAEWGEGAVQRYEGDKMVVLFDRTGYRTLAVDLVLEQGLLEPAGGFGPTRGRGTARKASRKETDMPATKKKDLPSTLKRSPAKAQRTWAETHDSAVETYGEGERAHRTAFASLKHSFKKVGDHWEPKDRKGPSDPQAARSGAAARRGGKTYGGVDLYGSTKKELLEQARKLDVKGRSSMNKQELAEAVAKKSR